MPIDKTSEIQARLRHLFASQQLGVLATSDSGQPYTSLVAFVASADLHQLYFVTSRSTRKYANLSGDQRVSMLINSSTNTDADFHQAVAATAVGIAEEPSGKQRQHALAGYLAKHPYLEDFASSPSCALICVRVHSYLLVRNFQHVMEWHLQPRI